MIEAYCESKKQFYSEGGNLNPWGDKGNGADFIQFGLTPKNREIVETLTRYLKEQKFINEIPDIDALFVLGSGDWSDA